MGIRRAAGLLFLSLLILQQVTAQEISLGAWSWLEPEDAPDTLPRLEKTSTDVPEQLRTATGYEYFVQVLQLDPKTRTELHEFASSSPWLKPGQFYPVNEGRKPALKQKKPVYAKLIRIGIFNPAAAETKLQNRLPRLEAVVPVNLDELNGQTKEQPEDLLSWAGRSVLAELQIDASGAVIESTLKDELPFVLQRAASSALLEWRFSPALKEGQPVATTVSVPVLFHRTTPAPHVSGHATLPKLIKSITPVYPPSFRRYGIVGSTTLSFMVGLDGYTSRIRVLSSSHPAFSAAAIEAARAWIFEPARIDGVACRLLVSQTITFQMEGTQTQEVAEVKKGDQSQLPEALRVDVPAKLKHLPTLIHPYSLLGVDKRASVKVAFILGADGKATGEMSFTEAKPEFQLAAGAMIDAMEFEPASKAGRPNPSLVSMTLDFNENFETELSSSERDVLRQIRKNKAKFAKPSDLDGKPEPLVFVQPVFPSTLRRQGIRQGSATVELYIDYDGVVLLPHAIKATAPEFGYAAVQAVRQWKFKPVKVKGKPTTVRVTIPFNFQLTEPPAS